MTALALSLKRIWSARNRVPRLTGWGTSGSLQIADETALGWAYDRLLSVIELARRSAPTVFVIAYTIFR